MALRIGDQILVEAQRADGTWYRRFVVTIEQIHDDAIVTMAPVGTRVEAIDTNGWTQEYAIRTFFWFDRPYNLLEVYRADGSLVELYVHIASPAVLRGSTLVYKDYELDVVLTPGATAQIVDKDDFEHAALVYGYSPSFQAACRAAAAEAMDLVQRWAVRG